MLRFTEPELAQGFPEGYSEDCWPVRLPGLQQHACRPSSRADAEERERLRFALLGNAVTVDVARWLGERLLRLYECAPPLFGISSRGPSTLCIAEFLHETDVNFSKSCILCTVLVWD